MAKARKEIFVPSEEEANSIRLCFKNDLAYVIQPIKNANKYNIIKYQISNYNEVFYYKENDKIIEFTEIEALKKTMELYKFHSKRFNK